MSIEVVLDQKNGFCIGILLGKPFHKMSIIYLCPMLLDTNHSFSCMKVKSNKDATCTIADVFVMLLL